MKPLKAQAHVLVRNRGCSSKHSHIPASSLYFHPLVLDGFSIFFLAMPRASLCLTAHQQSPHSHHQLASLHGLCLKPCPQPEPHLPRGRQNPFSPPVEMLSDTQPCSPSFHRGSPLPRTDPLMLPAASRSAARAQPLPSSSHAPVNPADPS